MMSEWQTAKIEDVVEKVAMGPFGSSIKVSTFVPSGVPVISGQHIHGSRLADLDYNFISFEHADKLANANVRRGDVVFTHAGNIGQVAYIPETSRYERYVISQRQFYMRCDRRYLLPDFAAYYFKTPEGQHKLLANTSSSGVPSIARPVSYLRTIEIPLPPLSEQRAIAHILGTLDDKIELNRRTNETLEEMARVIFKSGFVDFDPVRAKAEGRDPGLPEHIADLFPDRFEDSELGEIPAGWSVESLDGIAHFLNGLALQKYPPEDDKYLPAIKIAELRNGVTETSGKASTEIPSKYVVEDGDLLFSWSGSLEVRLWTGGRGALNQHLFKVTSEKYPKWFPYFWLKLYLPRFRDTAADKATTMGHIKRRHLTDALVVAPPEATLQAMDVTIASIVNKVVANSLEARALAAIRDLLLPKLVSGEIRAQEAEEIVEGVR